MTTAAYGATSATSCCTRTGFEAAERGYQDISLVTTVCQVAYQDENERQVLGSGHRRRSAKVVDPIHASRLVLSKWGWCAVRGVPHSQLMICGIHFHHQRKYRGARQARSRHGGAED